MKSGLVAALAALLAVALVIAGCGGGGDAELSKAEVIEKGDAICKTSSRQIEDEAEKFAEDNDIDTGNPTKKQQEEVIETVVAPGLRSEAEELEGLGAPREGAKQLETTLAALNTGIDKLESEPGLLLGDKNPLGKASTLAGEFGFEACGQE